MHHSATKDIRNVLSTAYFAIKKKNYFALEGLANQLNHSITIYQDKKIADCAVTVYALSKIFDKEDYLKHEDFKIFKKRILISLKTALVALKKTRMTEYAQSIAAAQKQILNFGDKIQIYRESVLDYARARKAKHATEHGISLNRASELFEVKEWEITSSPKKKLDSKTQRTGDKSTADRLNLIGRIFKIS